MNAPQVLGMGGALQALWTATGGALAAVATLSRAANQGAEALEKLATVGNETAGTYLDETRASRRAKLLELDRQYEALQASGTPALTTTAPVAITA